jgi:hypothetical protein
MKKKKSGVEKEAARIPVENMSNFEKECLSYGLIIWHAVSPYVWNYLETTEGERIGASKFLSSIRDDAETYMAASRKFRAEIARLNDALRWRDVAKEPPEIGQEIVARTLPGGAFKVNKFDWADKNKTIPILTQGYLSSLSFTHWLPLPPVFVEGGEG